ncbi:NXPE family member 1-like [Diadema antillarum]|uniref:NXPE family member 1-like n=1 Tax=Diadema antillarum TaxID=105358 RepID=UPI003A88C646
MRLDAPVSKEYTLRKLTFGHVDAPVTSTNTCNSDLTKRGLETRWRHILSPWNTTRRRPYPDEPIAKGSIGQSLVAVDVQPISMGLTSAVTSDYELISPQHPSVGDTLHYHLFAKDANGRARHRGGDFWYAVLQTPKLKASTAARIVDHDNGTYSLYFLAGWAGKVQVNVTLVHPSEAVDYLRSSFRHEEKKVQWEGMFTSAERTENSLCWVAYSGEWSKVCEYRPVRALFQTRILCSPPPSLPCNTLRGLRGTTTYRNQFERVLPREKVYLFQEGYVHAKLQFSSSVTIQATREGSKVLDRDILPLPTCQPDLPVTVSDGFWFGNRWHSLVCSPQVEFRGPSIRSCLKHQNVFFTGDSTTRQWFSAVVKALGRSKPEDNQFKNKSFYLERRDTMSDINFKFIFHPLSLHPHAVFVNLSVVRFEADVLLGLPRDSCNHVVVFSPWAHFPNYPWRSYLEWLEGVRDALLVARERCPGLKFVVKTPHPVNMQQEMKARDWMFYQMRAAMFDAFSGVGALFVDTWDMNLSYPSAPSNMHMPDKVISEEISLFLSHLCSR